MYTYNGIAQRNPATSSFCLYLLVPPVLRIAAHVSGRPFATHSVAFKPSTRARTGNSSRTRARVLSTRCIHIYIYIYIHNTRHAARAVDIWYRYILRLQSGTRFHRPWVPQKSRGRKCVPMECLNKIWLAGDGWNNGVEGNVEGGRDNVCRNVCIIK